ncbi:MAG: histidine--tRNA ligase [Chloroflexi bacterium]|nr:histidine--tRNA ligase [Chloroflexota bacterium]
MKTLIPSVKGARDFYPREFAIRRYLYDSARAVSTSFGYEEFDGPFLETIELYAAKSGDELVKEQSFVFPDRSGELITLRPELTPSLARMVAQRQQQLVYPVRWWSFGPFWRYERPQKGRSREFFQWNNDIFGVDTPEADAELVAVACAFFARVGLSAQQVSVLVNNRRLVDAELSAMNIPSEQRPAVSRLIDRRNKMSIEAWQAYAVEIGLTSVQFAQIVNMLDDNDLWRKSEELIRFFTAVEALGCADYVRFDPNVVRGLDYYTGIVFEALAVQGNLRRSILGGGRYDNLLADVGGQPLPGVGFAMGDVAISILLEEYGLLPAAIFTPPAPILMTVFDQASLLGAFSLAADLRRAGLKINCYPEAGKLGKQFKFADRIGARFALVYGPDEQASGLVAIKDLKSGDQTSVRISAAADTLLKLLA